MSSRRIGAHGTHHVAQLIFRIRDRQCLDGFQGVGLALETWAFAGFEVQTQAHGIGNGQNVREQDCGVQLIATQWLQSHFTGQFSVFAQ